MLQPGDHVGRYEIQTTVGEGGFGKVYRAWDPELERLVAIKELSSERKTDEPTKHAEYRERFRLERRVQGQFQHPHIVSVYDLVQQDDNEYLVEQFVEGGTLRALLEREGRLPPERAIAIGMEMCQAIAAIWERDIVHRDIKPGNILLTADGHARLSDFGIAQVGRMSQRTLSDTRHPGSPAYMSPEQERGGGYLDERSDLYSLGLALYEALTGKSYKRERVPARRLAPDVPPDLEKVVMRALAQDPADRYQSVGEFETALRAILDKPRQGRRQLAWPRWAGGVVLLVLIIGGWLIVRTWSQAAVPPAPTATSLPALMPMTPSPPSIPTPTLAATVLTPSAMPTLTVTATGPTPTRTPAVTVSAPRLISPRGADWICSSRFNLRWQGPLPDSSYGFRASLRNDGRALNYVSPLLDDTQWTVDVPGNAAGEWRWSVAVVHRGGSQEAVARSDEWTLYYTPFCTSISPLPTPTQQ